ncbi:hypothetical protein GQ53DRAFT_621445, partial [Thozetella sp. PMI_491]
FDTKFSTPVHILQLVLAIVVLGIAGARLVINGGPRSRADTMALGMGAKSVVIILYQLLTEHVRALHRWFSYMACAILNAMEIVFWAAVAYLVISANAGPLGCSGLTCTLSWVIVVLAIVIAIVAAYAAIISYLDVRHYRQTGLPRG